MERKRLREIAIAAVAITLIGVAVFRIRATMSASSPDPVAQNRRVAGSALSTAPTPVADVDLRALQAARPGLVESTRNPFSFRSKPPPAPAPSAARAAMAAGPAPTPPPPPIALKFIGVMDSPSTGRIAVLSDTRGVYQGREGEILEGRYRIIKIGVESIDLAYLDGRGRQTIRLTGQ